MTDAWVDRELVDVVNRRLDLLATLQEPTAKRDLVDELDLSRSTVDRAVRQLESMGLVTREPEYRTTVTGRLVRSLFEGFVDDLGDVLRAEELLGALPPDAPMSMDLLEGATVDMPSAATPTAPVSAALETLHDTTHVNLLVPRITRPGVLDVLETKIVAEETPTRLVLSPGLVDHLEAEHSSWLTAVTGAENAEVRVTDGLPYTLGLLRRPESLHVGVLVYDADGNVQGFVQNETLRAYSWGWNVFEDVYEAADPIQDVR